MSAPNPVGIRVIIANMEGEVLASLTPGELLAEWAEEDPESGSSMDEITATDFAAVIETMIYDEWRRIERQALS